MTDYDKNLKKIFGYVSKFLGRDFGRKPNDNETKEIKELLLGKDEAEENKGKFIVISQRDSKWKNEMLGKSFYSVGDFGCLITCLSMLSAWYGDYKDPKWIARNLKFTPNGLFLWKSMDGKLPFNFKWRYYGRDDSKIQEILNSKDNACVLQVNDKKHWVELIGYDKGKGYKVVDPFYGDTVWLRERFKNITGFAEVTKA